MSKAIAICTAILTIIGSATFATESSNAGPQVSEQASSSNTVPDRALVAQCHSQARARHSNGTFTLNRFNQSPNMRRHTNKLASFCSAYEGQMLPEYIAQIGEAADNANPALAFAKACKAEARAGHTVIFRPSTQHVDTMTTLCDRMAHEIASR